MELDKMMLMPVRSDSKVKYKNDELVCYKKKELDKLYPQGDYEVIGETKRNNRKNSFAQLVVANSNEEYLISKLGSHSSILYRKAGFASVGDDKYVALLKNRFVFFLLFLALLGALVAGIILLVNLINFKPKTPDNPLPPPDPYIETIPGDDTEKTVSEKGGGMVSMIYTLSAKINVTEKQAKIYFRNPNASNHDVVLELYMLSGGNRIKIGESGRIPAGSGLYTMDIDTSAVQLSEGKYNGLNRVIYYNPETGERAIVNSEITDVICTVTE